MPFSVYLSCLVFHHLINEHSLDAKTDHLSLAIPGPESSLREESLIYSRHNCCLHRVPSSSTCLRKTWHSSELSFETEIEHRHLSISERFVMERCSDMFMKAHGLLEAPAMNLLDLMAVLFLIFLKNLCTLSNSCCVILHSHQQCTRLLISPHPHQTPVTLYFFSLPLDEST